MSVFTAEINKFKTWYKVFALSAHLFICLFFTIKGWLFFITHSFSCKWLKLKRKKNQKKSRFISPFIEETLTNTRCAFEYWFQLFIQLCVKFIKRKHIFYTPRKIYEVQLSVLVNILSNLTISKIKTGSPPSWLIKKQNYTTTTTIMLNQREYNCFWKCVHTKLVLHERVIFRYLKGRGWFDWQVIGLSPKIHLLLY